MRSVALLTGGAALLGSCGGMMLSRYTVAGMNDFYFYDRSSFAYASPEPEPSRWAEQFGGEFEPVKFDDIFDSPDVDSDQYEASRYEAGRYDSYSESDYEAETYGADAY